MEGRHICGIILVLIITVIAAKAIFPSSVVLSSCGGRTETCQNMPPAIYISLDDAIERRASLEPHLQGIFQQMHRIPGVKASDGHEGCRMAHIHALGFGVQLDVPYFLIFEDDVQPLVCEEECRRIIHEAMALNVDLALLEIGQNLERNIHLEPTSVKHFLRIFGGGNNAGCYLVKSEFARVLQQFWIDTPNEMIDHSWQKLWPEYFVVLSKPQLYHQKEGFSLTLRDVRPETKPFDWELYDFHHPR
jgi:GR25 family glycosyltransferase involved in LPS biosynthesis